MLGKEIIVEGSPFYYDSNFEYNSLSGEYTLITTNDILEYLDKKQVSKFCKPILTAHYQEKHFFLDYLFWFEDVNITEIDYKIMINEFSDSDFKHSIKTQFYKKVKCRSCHTEYKNVLVVDPVLIYPNNFDLGDKKKEELIKRNKMICCSNCGSEFNLLVVHIFGEF